MSKPIREVISTLYQSPMNDMSFVRYFSFLNESGKITARSLMDGLIIAYTFIEELEKRNESYEGNFKEIENVLGKLVDTKIETVVATPIIIQPILPDEFIDPKEALKQKRIESLAKARAAKKLKQQST